MAKKKFRILSIDGGGLRGIVPLMVLKQIELETGKRIHEMFDMFVGTSTGGIIVCGLLGSSDGKSPNLTVEMLMNLYTSKADEIFPYGNFITRPVRKLWSWIRPKFSPSGLDKNLSEYFGELNLSDLLKPGIVTSYDIKNHEVVMFKSRKSNEQGYDVPLSKVCRATSAAPTYLRSYKMDFGGKDRVCVDGGVYINNPSMAAVADAIKTYGMKASDIEVLSLGTGTHPPKFEQSETYGKLQWAAPISEVMMAGTSAAAAYECEFIVGKHVRVQVKIHDEDRKDMADSRPSTADYIKSLVRKQVLENEDVMNSIRYFY